MCKGMFLRLRWSGGIASMAVLSMCAREHPYIAYDKTHTHHGLALCFRQAEHDRSDCMQVYRT